MNIQDLTTSLNGKLYGNDDFFSIDGFTGKFTFLDDAHTGDIVIREWIDPIGVQMAFKKNIACLITPHPKEGAIEMAERLNFPFIIIKDMQTAEDFIIQYTKDNDSASSESAEVVINKLKDRELPVLNENPLKSISSKSKSSKKKIKKFKEGKFTPLLNEVRQMNFIRDVNLDVSLIKNIHTAKEFMLKFKTQKGSITINDLTNFVDGKLVGNDEFFSIEGFTGQFTFLNEAHTGDIVVRHWIDATGVQMAFKKNIACLITQTPRDGAEEIAERLNFPLIVTDKIELANAFALAYTIENYSHDSINIIITGTNGKSTTSHLIYHILDNAGYHVLTNTDSESEFNTLIDPMVSKLIYDEVSENGSLDYLVIEVSEVQGWLDRFMKHHAALMTKSCNPQVGVITNIAMDHIGLVNSIDDVYNEIKMVPMAIDEGITVLNYDDELVRDLEAENPFYTSMSKLDYENSVYLDGENIIYMGNPILTLDELPFTGNHFIQNILSAIGACISLNIDIDKIVDGVKTYKALNRRFAKLNDEPLIYDDFAHNPDGIKLTIAETLKLLPENQKLHVACAIRGSRGVEINQLNVEALAESIDENVVLYLSSSNDVVNNLNFVEDEEREVFFNTLNKKGIEFTHFDNLKDCLTEVYNNADNNDIILLIGAQGMDPAESLLSDII